MGQDYWPRAPVHRISEHGTYIVTAGTYEKQHFFHASERPRPSSSFSAQDRHETGWDLEAWAVFSNHYHFVGHSRANSAELSEFAKLLHGRTAIELNRDDHKRDRQVWHNYWDTRLTYEKSYYARLNYVHHNAVRHGLVRVANQYRWCSASWFERTATRAQVNTIYRFKIVESTSATSSIRSEESNAAPRDA